MLAYLSRYTHRVAISNSRLLALDARGVTFRWKDYRRTRAAQARCATSAMTLSPQEFMRCFLLHVLPGGFHRIRHYGLLANSNRRDNLALVRALLHTTPPPPPPDEATARCGVRPPPWPSPAVSSLEALQHLPGRSGGMRQPARMGRCHTSLN